MIKENIKRIKDKIKSICLRNDRNPDDIVLVGISKYADISQIKEALAAGLNHIGENKVQDAKKKFEELNFSAPVVRHLVGHLQTNKVKTAVEIFDIIHSVDSLRLASEIQRCSEKLNKKMNVLAQINISGEVQKSGMDPRDIKSFVEGVLGYKNIQLLGLMTIGPLTEDRDLVREHFKRMKEIFDQIKNEYKAEERVEMKYLSMGMSGDYDLALEEGSNMIRIGKAIFHDT